MIDTVCLLIPKEKMTYLSGVSGWELLSRADQYEKYVRNPNKTEKETGVYYPRLTGYKRRFAQGANVRIEFSTSKLLFSNNLEELEEKDFPKVIEVLQERLKTMGVIAPKSVLENASISSVHFSKNIKLEDGYTSNHLISEMNKVNLRKSFDFAKTRFMNDGQSLYAHTTSHEFVVYDKIADLSKDKKRAIDKDKPPHQLSLFNELDKKKMLEVIRFEARLNHKQKMNKLLEQLGYQKDPAFKDVFNAELSKKVVNDYWRRLIKECNLGLFSVSLSVKDILRALFLVDNKLKPKQTIYLVGLFILARDEGGMRQLRSIVSKRSHDRTWYRIVSDIKRTSKLIIKNEIRDWVRQIDRALEDYKPFKINNYENKER